MSNLSDLLPSGGGQNIVDFTASGTVASGKPVILNANGTVSQVAAVAESIGSKSVYDTDTEDNRPAFDTSNNKVVIAYKDDGNSSYGTAVVGTVSGSGITYGTPVVFHAGTTDDVVIAFDSTNNKFMVAYKGASNHGKCIVGTVSGTSISFGSEFEFAGAITTFVDIVFDSSVSRFLINYVDAENSNYGTCRIVYISGTSVVAAGAEIVFHSSSTSNISSAFDSDEVRVAITYVASGAGRVRLAKNLGNAQPDFNTQTAFDSGAGSGTAKPENSTVYDSVNKKILISYRDNSNSSYGTTLVGTVSAADNAITFGTEVVFEAAEVHSISSTVDTTNNRLVVFYYDVGNSSYGTYVVGTVSGTSISFGTPVVIASSTTANNTGATFDSNAGKVVLTYRDLSDSGKGTAQVLQNASTNLTSTNFIGLADAAISDTATGKINVKGSINSKQSSLTIGSDYYVQSDGSVSTTSTSPAVKIGQAVTATTINMMDLT